MTPARAAKLDLITVAPAPASTALSTVIQSYQVGQNNAATNQTGGNFSWYMDTTVSAVNPAKTLVIAEYVRDTAPDCGFRAFMFNSTTLRCEATAAGKQPRLAFQIIEFK
jgi:hypothetical protein